MGQKKWEPRLNLPRNSGLLYHATGPHGAFWNTWKRSLEFEVAENDFGDLYPLGGTRADVAAKLPAKVWTYDPSGDASGIDHFDGRAPANWFGCKLSSAPGCSMG